MYKNVNSVTIRTLYWVKKYVTTLTLNLEWTRGRKACWDLVQQRMKVGMEGKYATLAATGPAKNPGEVPVCKIRKDY